MDAITKKAATLLKKQTKYLKEDEQKKLHKILLFAIDAHEGQTRKSGEPYITHPIAVAGILAGWHADYETLAAALLHDVLEDTPVTKKELIKNSSEIIAKLVEAVSKITQADLKSSEQKNIATETLRRLFDVMSDDVRTIFIKLADRVHNLRTIEARSLRGQKRAAQETLDVYYPIARHLNLNDVRKEFANICVPILYPEEVVKLKDVQKKAMTSAKKTLAKIKEALKKQNIEGLIKKASVEPSYLFEMFKRHKQQKLSYRSVFHILIITNNEEDIYTILHDIHRIYRPKRDSLRDYIAAPSDRSYQAVHTTVLGPNNEYINIRIRTPKMEQRQRLGIAYDLFQTDTKPDITWLTNRLKLLNISNQSSSNTYLKALQSDILKNTITVIVDGKPVLIPEGSTALDAVFIRHDKEALKITSLKRNDEYASFSFILSGDDEVRTAVQKESQASIKWLNAVKTSHARQFILKYLKKNTKKERREIGSLLLQREMDIFKIGTIAALSKYQKQRLTDTFKQQSITDLIEHVGSGVIKAKEVVFCLLEKKSVEEEVSTKTYNHRLLLTTDITSSSKTISRINKIARLNNVSLQSISYQKKQQQYKMNITSNKQIDFTNFFSEVELQPWAVHLSSLVSKKKQCFIVSSFIAAFLSIVLVFSLLPWYQLAIESFSNQLAWRILPIIPIIFINYLLLKILMYFFVFIRRNHWFFGLTILLNLLGIIGVLLLSDKNMLIPYLSVFILAMIVMAYRYFQQETVVKVSKPALDKQEWQDLKKRKIAGYLFRTFAVIVWGVQPLYLRYTPAVNVAPIIRVFLMALGVLAITWLLQIFQKSKKNTAKKIQPAKLYFHPLLYCIVIGQITFTYFLNASLIETTSTNFILFNNFSPVIALLIAAIFWRKSIPYLQDSRNMFAIFAIFILGSIGGSLLLYNTALGNSGSISGDTLGLLAMIFDTFLVISQINYMKKFSDASSLSINIFVFTWQAVAIIPVIIYLLLTSSPALWSLALIPVLYSIGAGVLSGVGKLLNYETFRRIDGFIAFLMFNISILITFTAEALFLHTITPTWMLIVGGLLIISSTVFAEIINGRSQKLGQ